jgi:two-component system, response regulator PdtaR
MTGRSEATAHRDSAAKRVVLLLEDDFWTRYTAAEFLRAMGYQVIEGKDADDGITVLSAGTHVDAIFTDIRMPGSLDGLAFAQWVGVHYPYMPVLLTSGVPPSAPPAAPLRRFVTKPYLLFDVEREIRSML